jgi:predicted short-subunit dehydrogenase-like oxidoreductase (DUF2520 family)
MVRLALIGYGNLGWHLHQRLSFSFHVDVYTRAEQQITPECKSIKLSAQVVNYDLVLIAVGDSNIPEVIPYIDQSNGMVCHTSGTADLSILEKFENRGVFYPLQTFSSGDKIDWLEVPIFIESSNETNTETLEFVGKKMSNLVIEANSKKRKNIHLSAVIGANFSYALCHRALDKARENDIAPGLFEPLFKKNLEKLFQYYPENKLTGPAKRGDQNTLKSHLALLKSDPKLADLYAQLSDYIQDEL